MPEVLLIGIPVLLVVAFVVGMEISAAKERRVFAGAEEVVAEFLGALAKANLEAAKRLLASELRSVAELPRFSTWSIASWQFVNRSAVAAGTLSTAIGDVDVEVHLSRSPKDWRVVSLIVAGKPLG